jgi:hypothetical protein
MAANNCPFYFLTMLYNPVSKQLFSDAGTFLKQLHCPLQKQWDELSLIENLHHVTLKGR